jgi:hypothetical protein
VVHASDIPSGDQTGPNSPVVAVETRCGVPPGQSITYTRSSAENATRLPSGEGWRSRTCLAVSVAAVSTRYANFTSGPIASSTSAVNGILAGAPWSTGTRQISPP